MVRIRLIMAAALVPAVALAACEFADLKDASQPDSGAVDAGAVDGSANDDAGDAGTSIDASSVLDGDLSTGGDITPIADAAPDGWCAQNQPDGGRCWAFDNTNAPVDDGWQPLKTSNPSMGKIESPGAPGSAAGAFVSMVSSTVRQTYLYANDATKPRTTFKFSMKLDPAQCSPSNTRLLVAYVAFGTGTGSPTTAAFLEYAAGRLYRRPCFGCQAADTGVTTSGTEWLPVTFDITRSGNEAAVTTKVGTTSSDTAKALPTGGASETRVTAGIGLNGSTTYRCYDAYGYPYDCQYPLTTCQARYDQVTLSTGF